MDIEQKLSGLRQSIDAIDREIIERLNERVRLASEVGRIKHREGGSIYVPSREELIFEKLSMLNTGPLPKAAVRSIWREIISASISLEKPLVIAYLGPEATYTHQAALKNFGSSLQYKAVKTIPDVIAEVERGDADYGVFPVENSTGGVVNHSQEALVESDVKIISQVFLKVEHCLLSENPLTGIKKIFSKDQAFSQCRDWLRRHVPDAVLVEVDSTTRGVELAKQTEGGAAIASELAAQLYQIEVAARGIQDRVDNSTRFLVIGKGKPPAMGEGKDRTSLVFSIRDEVGALQGALDAISSRGINMCKIESCPTRRKPWDYYFFVDIIGHIDEPKIAEIVTQLQSRCQFVKWLGSYPNVQE